MPTLSDSITLGPEDIPDRFLRNLESLVSETTRSNLRLKIKKKKKKSLGEHATNTIQFPLLMNISLDVVHVHVSLIGSKGEEP